jgi:hypothetical protein
MRSYAENDRWNDASFGKTHIRDESISEVRNNDEFSTYSRENLVIRVQSKDTRVSELTEMIPAHGFRRKSSGRSEKALPGGIGTLQAQKYATLSKQKSNGSVATPPLTLSSWNLSAEPLYTIDDGIDDYDEDKICDNTASFRSPSQNVGTNIGEESMDPLPTPTGLVRGYHGNTPETPSSSYHENMSVSKKSTDNKQISDKASQKTSSSASTQRRGNHVVVNARGDASASLSSGLTSTDLHQPSQTPIMKGLLACSRGNKLERLAARKEELEHIMVFDPTPRLTQAQNFTFESPKSDLTRTQSTKLPNRVSIYPSGKGNSRPVPIHVHEPSTDKPALLLSSQNSARKQTLTPSYPPYNTAPHSRTVVSPSTTISTPVTNADTSSKAATKSILRHSTLTETLSDEDLPNPHPKAYASFRNKAIPPVKTNLETPRWPIPGLLTSELDQLAPLGKPPPKQPRIPRKKPYQPPKPTWKAPPASPPSSPTQLSQVFSENETTYTDREESTYVTGYTSNPTTALRRGAGSTVYERKRMASRLAFPTFHWQADDASIGVMSLNYE